MKRKIVCIGCGCTEERACPGRFPCYWVAIHTESGDGICSNCAIKPPYELITAFDRAGVAIQAAGAAFAEIFAGPAGKP